MKKIKDLVGIAAGIVLAVGPYTFLHVCSDMSGGSEMGGMEMGGMDMASGAPCHGVPAASLVVGIILIAVSLISLIIDIRDKDNNLSIVSTALDVIITAAGVAAIGIPTFIVGVCSSAHMHCHMVTRPALIIIGVIVGVVGLVSLAYRVGLSFKEEVKKDGRVLLNEQPQ